MVYYVYILKSLKDARFYIGYTQNIEERLKRHNSGKVFSTKHRIPFEVVYKENQDTLRAALLREKYLKNLKRDRLKELINNGGCRSTWLEH